MKTKEGPIIHERDFIVYKGDSFKPEFAVYDGEDLTVAKPFGTTIDISAATKRGVLTVNKADGTSDVSKDTSVAGEGSKADTQASGYVDTVQFVFAQAVTAGWEKGIRKYEVVYEDSAPTTPDKKLVATGNIVVKDRPSSG